MEWIKDLGQLIKDVGGVPNFAIIALIAMAGYFVVRLEKTLSANTAALIGVKETMAIVSSTALSIADKLSSHDERSININSMLTSVQNKILQAPDNEVIIRIHERLDNIGEVMLTRKDFDARMTRVEGALDKHSSECRQQYNNNALVERLHEKGG